MAKLRSWVRRTDVSLGLKVKSNNAKVAIAVVKESVLTTKFCSKEIEGIDKLMSVRNATQTVKCQSFNIKIKESKNGTCDRNDPPRDSSHSA
jgi:hypothetical protein